MSAFLISRNVALDLIDYWDAVDANDEDSEFARDNAGCIEAVREAYLALGRAKGAKPLLLVEASDAAVKEVFDQAENCLDIVEGLAEDAKEEVAMDRSAEMSYRSLMALRRAYKRLLKQRKTLGL